MFFSARRTRNEQARNIRRATPQSRGRCPSKLWLLVEVVLDVDRAAGGFEFVLHCLTDVSVVVWAGLNRPCGLIVSSVTAGG